MRAATAARWPVAIGQAAERAGVSARMVRHYEGLGLLAGVARTDSGYRQYTEADVHTLRPGLTGWAQINGRDELPIAQKVALDAWYLQHQSFWCDARILCLTALRVLRRDGIAH